MPQERWYSIARLAFVFFVLIILAAVPAREIENAKTEAVAEVSSVKHVEAPPEIKARAALAEDFVTGNILFEKNKNEILPLASLTKIVSILVILDYALPDEEVVITRNISFSSQRQNILKKGSTMLLSDLISIVMEESSNNAVSDLAEYVAAKNGISRRSSSDWFLDKMRQKVASAGSETMRFNNLTGLDVSGSLSGGYGSALDIVRVVRYSFDSLLWQFNRKSEVKSKEGHVYALKPTNRIEYELFNLIGSKTGLTDLAGGNLLVIVELPLGHPVGIVVMGATETGRFEDVKTILSWIQSQL